MNFDFFLPPIFFHFHYIIRSLFFQLFFSFLFESICRFCLCPLRQNGFNRENGQTRTQNKAYITFHCVRIIIDKFIAITIGWSYNFQQSLAVNKHCAWWRTQRQQRNRDRENRYFFFTILLSWIVLFCNCQKSWSHNHLNLLAHIHWFFVYAKCSILLDYFHHFRFVSQTKWKFTNRDREGRRKKWQKRKIYFSFWALGCLKSESEKRFVCDSVNRLHGCFSRSANNMNRNMLK